MSQQATPNAEFVIHAKMTETGPKIRMDIQGNCSAFHLSSTMSVIMCDMVAMLNETCRSYGLDVEDVERSYLWEPFWAMLKETKERVANGKPPFDGQMHVFCGPPDESKTSSDSGRDDTPPESRT